MDKKQLIGISICAVVLLVLGSLSNVVGYQTVQSTNQSVIKERINQKELLFQTIVDISNNKEIQRIIMKSQMSRGIFPTSEIPVITKNQLKQMYILGLILSKVISKSRIQSLVQQYQLMNPQMQKEIYTVIEKDATLKAEITQLQTSECECENENITEWSYPIIICFILAIINYALGKFYAEPLIKLGEFFYELGLSGVADLLIKIFGPPFLIVDGIVIFLIGLLCVTYP